jgi:uncharacterized membrane protein YdcZ (DUF606 family)
MSERNGCVLILLFSLLAGSISGITRVLLTRAGIEGDLLVLVVSFVTGITVAILILFLLDRIRKKGDD